MVVGVAVVTCVAVLLPIADAALVTAVFVAVWAAGALTVGCGASGTVIACAGVSDDFAAAAESRVPSESCDCFWPDPVCALSWPFADLVSAGAGNACASVLASGAAA